MKAINKIISLAALFMTLFMAGCEGEKQIIIIEETLPIKTSVLYFLGDATPAGWDNGNPTEFTQSEEDKYVFVYEGVLNRGEFKAMLAKGSWDVPFIRPSVAGLQVGKSGIAEAPFIMHAGDPDEKWQVTEAGVYRITFNLKAWTYNIVWLSEPPKDPINANNVYMVGDATPAGWNIDAPTPFTKQSQYVFVYQGKMNAGEFKCYTTTGDWGAKAIRPEAANVEISKKGAASDKFTYSAGPDDKWKVVDAGQYKITLDLKAYKITAEYLGE